MSIPGTVRNCVWNTYIGDEHKKSLCYCCNSEFISFSNFAMRSRYSKKK